MYTLNFFIIVMVYLTLFFINLKILESDDDSSIDSRYINLDIPVNLDRKTTKKIILLIM